MLGQVVLSRKPRLSLAPAVWDRTVNVVRIVHAGVVALHVSGAGKATIALRASVASTTAPGKITGLAHACTADSTRGTHFVGEVVAGGGIWRGGWSGLGDGSACVKGTGDEVKEIGLARGTPITPSPAGATIEKSPSNDW
jgi:hypothetical protein